MENLNEVYYQNLFQSIKHEKENWENKNSTNKDALHFFKVKQSEIYFFLKSNKPSYLKLKMLALANTVDKMIETIEEEMKTIYILKTRKDKVLAVADESLVKKCIARLGKENVKYSQMKVCQTEEDLDSIFLDDKLEEQLNGRVVHILTDKDCPLY